MFCSNCGKEMQPEDAFCSYCGSPSETLSEQNPQTMTNTVSDEMYGTAYVGFHSTEEAMPATSYTGVVPIVKSVKKTKKKTVIIIVAFALLIMFALGFLAYLYFFTNTFKSDEELIESRINEFVYAINIGNFDSAVESMCKEKREYFQEKDTDVDAYFKGLIGLEIGIEEAFKAGMTLKKEDLMTIDSIRIVSVYEDAATAVLTINVDTGVSILNSFVNRNGIKINVTLIREKDGFMNYDWYIKDLKIKKDSKSNAV